MRRPRVSQLFLDRCTRPVRDAQRSTQLGLARRQPPGRFGQLRPPLAPRLFECGCRFGGLLFEGPNPIDRRVVLRLENGEAGRQRRSLGRVFLVGLLPGAAAAATCASSAVRAWIS